MNIGMDGRVGGCQGVWVAALIDGWMDGWVDEWVG